eukprot:5457238-Amphidinium_carterae.8
MVSLKVVSSCLLDTAVASAIKEGMVPSKAPRVFMPVVGILPTNISAFLAGLENLAAGVLPLILVSTQEMPLTAEQAQLLNIFASIGQDIPSPTTTIDGQEGAEDAEEPSPEAVSDAPQTFDADVESAHLSEGLGIGSTGVQADGVVILSDTE